MKYIDAERVKAEIDKIVNRLKSNCDPNPLGTTVECMTAAEIEALYLIWCLPISTSIQASWCCLMTSNWQSNCHHSSRLNE